MATMKTLNGYGFNATELGGKAPEYYIQPRNLLDNSYWERISEIVNQRGQTSYSEQVYGIDRWYGRSYAQKTEVRDIDITVTATGAAYAGIKQKVCNIAGLAGEAVTLAAYVYSTLPVAVGFVDADDNAVYETVDNGSGTRLILCACTVPSDATTDTFIPRILLRTNAENDYMRCYWAALYEGSYTAETLPPYVPKGYAVELAECQRYALPFNDAGSSGFSGYLHSDGVTARIFIPTPIQFRSDAVPSISVYDITALRVYPWNAKVASISVSNVTNSGVLVYAILESNQSPNNTPCVLKFNTPFGIYNDL